MSQNIGLLIVLLFCKFSLLSTKDFNELQQLSGSCSDLFIHLDVTFNLHHSTKQQQSIKSFSPSIDVAFLMVSSA